MKINIGASQAHSLRWQIQGWKVQNFSSNHYNFGPVECGLLNFSYDLRSRDPFPYEDNSIELYYSSHTFEHVSFMDTQHAFKEIYRTLQPGGYVRITVPDISKDTQCDYLLEYDPFDNGKHISYYTESALINMFKNVGFKDVYRSSPQQSKCEELKGELFDDKPTWSIYVEARKED